VGPAGRPPAGGQAPPRRIAGGAVRYRYVGESRLIVEGPLTGRRYFFDRPGTELAVDARDADSLAGVPVLRRV
jgi:hypothetical protein